MTHRGAALDVLHAAGLLVLELGVVVDGVVGQPCLETGVRVLVKLLIYEKRNDFLNWS